MLKNLEDLIKTIRDRKTSSPDKSYTNKLLNDKDVKFVVSQRFDKNIKLPEFKPEEPKPKKVKE